MPQDSTRSTLRQQRRDLQHTFELEEIPDDGDYEDELDHFLDSPRLSRAHNDGDGDDNNDDDDDAISLNSDEESFLPGAYHRDPSTFSLFSVPDTIPIIQLTSTQLRGPIDLQKKVTFLNGLTLVVGLMIGSGLFSSPGPILAHTGAVGTSLVIWLVSGLLAITGALCYAELGTMLPMNGGEAVYLERAFGSLVSFLFGFVAIVALKVR
ncbi:hypothetical protein BC936DRAFT_142073 [Jimgerdemannia flammicorona]|uniref:Amino acid permease-domain-containing protein n=1 Tax=Jimgerdemannia flammicorona TaxID=994334 RepID=A0A433DFJ7_9FUNG|nr:hypothetical protein BC936DRAFT_142073 [Jimgerdemannia flammicorona]